MNSLLLLVNLLGLAIMVTLFHWGCRTRMKERKRWRSAESDYVRAQGGGRATEIRCCVKYNTYFTTEIPIPSTRSEIHHRTIKLNELAGGSFFFTATILSGSMYTFMLKRKNDFPRLLYIINIYCYNKLHLTEFKYSWSYISTFALRRRFYLSSSRC